MTGGSSKGKRSTPESARLRERRHLGGPVAWMARHSVAPNLLMLVLILGGITMSSHIKQEFLPRSDPDTIAVSMSLPGASPEEVEESVVLALESELGNVAGVEKLTATANEGSGRVSLDLSGERSREQVYADVVQAVGRVTTFPRDAEEPVISLATRRREVVELHLFGNVDPLSLRMAAERVRAQLLQHQDISQVELAGSGELELHLEVSRARLLAYDLTLDDIARRVREASLERSGGTLETGTGDLLLRLDTQRDRIRDFARIPLIADRRGTVVRLGDFATIREGFADGGQESTFNGKPSIRINVFRTGNETPIRVSEAVRGKSPPSRFAQAWTGFKAKFLGVETAAEPPSGLDAIMATLPEELQVVVLNDRSVYFKERMRLLLKNGFIGLLLVLVVLSLFLEFKLAFWVAVGLPTAFLGTLLFLPWMGFSINLVSMFAFILALGIVVDDAIVAGENIYEYLQRGMSRIDAAILGARDIAVPLSFSILTNIVAFIPLALVPGTFGAFWLAIPFIVATAFILSWVEALFILPTHLAAAAERKTTSKTEKKGRREPPLRFRTPLADALDRFVHRIYGPLLETALSWRYATVALMLGVLLIALAYSLSGRMGWGLFPEIPRDYATARAVMPVGASQETARTVRDRLEEAAREVIEENGGEQLATGIYANINGGRVELEVHLTNYETRPIPTAEFANKWRNATGTPAEARFVSYRSSFGGPGSGNALEVRLSHPDVATLTSAAGRLVEDLGAYDAVRDPNDGFTPGKAQLEFRPTEAAQSLGLTSEEISNQVRAAFFGVEALVRQEGRNEVTVRVRPPREERRSEGDVEQLLIRTADGGDVPLFEIAEVGRGRAVASIEREGGLRVVTVTANIIPPEDANRVVAALLGQILPALSNDFPGLSYELGGRQQTQRETMESFIYLTIPLALIIIYGLLAIPFRSYAQPAIVMTAIPFGFAGAILGHLIMGMSLSIISVFGIIALSGVVINAALVMIDYANKAVAAGASHTEAIQRAGIRRFRPILLTTMTTFGGLAPMIFETSRQAQFLIPMAVSLGYGIVFATTIVLFLVPCLYLILNDLRRFSTWPSRDPLPGAPAAKSPSATPAAIAAN